MSSISTANAGKEPHFPGVRGYTPLELPMTEKEIAALPADVLLAEIRHYMEIVEQKKEWNRNRKTKTNVVQLKGAHANARFQSRRPSR